MNQTKKTTTISSKLKAPSQVPKPAAIAKTRSTLNKENQPKPAPSTAAKRKLPSNVAETAAGKSTGVKVARTAAASTATTAAAKKKRPAWDTKGRLQDMEELAESLQQKISSSDDNVAQMLTQLQTSESRVLQLEQFRNNLENSLETKQLENKEQQSIIDDLRKQLKDSQELHKNDVQELKKEHSEQVSELKQRADGLKRSLDETESKLQLSHTECFNLKNTISAQSTSIVALESEVRALKLQYERCADNLSTRESELASLEEKFKKATQDIAELEEKLREEEQVRRSLHNTIQELKGNIRVFCRIRPPLASELGEQPAESFLHHFDLSDPDRRKIALMQESDDASGMKTVTKNYEFQFDKIFVPESSQADVFEEISQLVQSACDGYNVCIFAYGQTGSGKTFTMEGPENAFDSVDNMGMIPRGVLQIWKHTEKLKEKGWTYNMEGSFLEIYNETLRDLLGDGQSKKHEIKHVQSKTTVTDLTVAPLSSPEEVIALLKRASNNRKVAETNCNERSSRSHSVFMLRIVGQNAHTGEQCEGILNLIDLAGSERLSQSGSTGDRLKETQAINKSLSSLGDVIYALGNKDGHIPYRNSKLTYLLQNSLGGNSKTLMFVNVAPSAENFHETLCSLRFATKVNNCQIGTARRSTK